MNRSDEQRRLLSDRGVHFDQPPTNQRVSKALFYSREVIDYEAVTLLDDEDGWLDSLHDLEAHDELCVVLVLQDTDEFALHWRKNI